MKNNEQTRLIPIIIVTAPRASENQIKCTQGVAENLLKEKIWELNNGQTIEDHNCR